MAKKTIRKPKLKAYPPRPKGRITLDKAKTFAAKTDDAISANAKLMKEYNDKVGAKDKEKMQIGSIISGTKSKIEKFKSKNK